MEETITKQAAQQIKQSFHVTKDAQAPYISKEKGIISIYDNIFKKAARIIGWDWKLLAAQCYQESGFDPNAVSYVGAKGLMQIMPATARELSIGNVYSPEENIMGGARYLRMLNNRFLENPDRTERIKFILAAYNGGYGHIADAQALARKNGKNSLIWNEVAYYVNRLSEPVYYNDPVVRHGYMLGHETTAYVSSIVARWKLYGADQNAFDMPNDRLKFKRNKFTQGTDIHGPNDSVFMGK